MEIGMEMTRPNGKVYKSRKEGIGTVLFDGDSWDSGGCAVLVIRTGDYEAAREAAYRRLSEYDQDCAEMMGCGRFGWWRESIRNGDPYWTEDNVRGCPGFCFETR